MYSFHAAGLVAVLLTCVSADFELYRYYDRQSLAQQYNMTDACITALNVTIHCDEATTAMVGHGADFNYWYMSNITTLCTSACQTSLANWEASVESSCAGQTVNDGGVLVEAKALVLSFTYNYGIACMQDTASNWCFFESQTWQGSDYIRWDPTLCFVDDPPSQCNDSTFSLSDISDEMSAMTNLYESSFYCNECFLKLFRQRLLDPWLVPSNFTEYLIGEFDSVQSNCSTTLPYTTSSATLFLGTASLSTTATADITGTALAASAISATPTCLGRTLAPLAQPLICNDLSDTYNVSTGDARVATNDYNCQFNSTICLPPPCQLDTVWDSPSCATLAQRYSNSTYNVTTSQFLSWNENIQGSCDGVALGQRVCKDAPGGTYPSPVASINAPTGTGAYYTTATAAYPTQTGSIPDCGNYYLVVAGDDCYTVDIQFGISFAQLQKFNTYLYTNCTNLWLSYDVCVAQVTPPTKSTDGTCGPGVTCTGTTFGDCCSPYGYCGSGSSFCVNTNGTTATTDGTCGPSNGGTTCTNPSFGDCCSIYGNCGSTSDYCGAGNCYSGNCATDNGGPSTNGECGPTFAGNKTCTGTQFGTCCSSSGYCGSTSDYCAGSNCYSGACTS